MKILLKLGRLKVVLVAVFTAAFLLQAVEPVAARPTAQEKRSQAQRIRSEIASIDRNLDLTVEQYNQTRIALSAIESDIRANVVKLAQTEQELAKDRKVLATRLCDIYKRREISPIEVIFGAKTFQEFLLRLELVIRIGKQDAQIIEKVAREKRETEERKAQLEERKSQQERIMAYLARKEVQIESKIRERQRLLSGIQGEINQLEQEERQVALRNSSKITVSRGSVGRAHGGVVAVAMQQLGKPYRYGAAGPNAFDCSGLTMYCYAQIGISLPHSSAAQYGYGRRISPSQLAPGDLVFFGRPIHHVGIYIGGGRYIHAPRTGDVVKISPLNRGDFVGARRL